MMCVDVMDVEEESDTIDMQHILGIYANHPPLPVPKHQDILSKMAAQYLARQQQLERLAIEQVQAQQQTALDGPPLPPLPPSDDLPDLPPDPPSPHTAPIPGPRQPAYPLKRSCGVFQF